MLCGQVSTWARYVCMQPKDSPLATKKLKNGHWIILLALHGTVRVIFYRSNHRSRYEEHVFLTLWIRRVGGRGSFTSRSFMLMRSFGFGGVFFKYLMSCCQSFFFCLQGLSFLSVFNYTRRDYDTRRKRLGGLLVDEGGGFEAHC